MPNSNPPSQPDGVGPKVQKSFTAPTGSKEVQIEKHAQKIGCPAERKPESDQDHPEDNTDETGEREFLLNEEEGRGVWAKHIEFIMACVASAVGLGNVWRFPSVCYDNGGGAFLIPYLLSLVLAGFPLFFMELSLGQYGSLAPVAAFKKIMPAFQGIGGAICALSVLTCLYYNTIIAWAFFYMLTAAIALFSKDRLDWADCDARQTSIFTPECITGHQSAKCANRDDNMNIFYNFTCIANGTVDLSNVTRHLSSEQYFKNYVLNAADDLTSSARFGASEARLMVCTILAWFFVYYSLRRGVKSAGKAVYVTVIFPYTVLLLMVAYGCTLPGATDGIYYYITPRWKKLAKSKAWVFFSLGVTFGPCVTIASHNNFHGNILRDALIVTLINSATSMFAGFAVFASLGYMAKVKGVNVEDVVTGGKELVFITYPEMFGSIAGTAGVRFAAIWAVLFFTMLFFIGIGSEFSLLLTVISTITDTFPSLRRRKNYVAGSVCAVCCIIAFSFCSENGIHLFGLMDGYSGSYGAVMIAPLEMLFIAYLYRQDLSVIANVPGKQYLASIGSIRFLDDISAMMKKEVFGRKYFIAMWCVVSPILLILLCIVTFYYSHPLKNPYTKEPYGSGFQSLGWLIAVIPVLMVPGFFLYRVAKLGYQVHVGKIYEFKKYFLKLLRPSPYWLPAGQREKRKKLLKAKIATVTITGDMDEPSISDRDQEPPPVKSHHGGLSHRSHNG